MKVVKHWNSLPREIVGCPSTEAFKVFLEMVLSNSEQVGQAT